jgi:hypothetical protein
MPRKQREEIEETPGVGLEVRLRPTGMNHIYNFDVLGDGRFREVAVVKMVKAQDGSVRSVYYIDVMLLDNIDKGRIKGIITNRHADKYELWDLMSQSTLNNGKNALDYFHQLTRVEHGKGAINTGFGGGLANARIEGSSMVGSEFSDPTSAALDTQAV